MDQDTTSPGLFPWFTMENSTNRNGSLGDPAEADNRAAVSAAENVANRRLSEQRQVAEPQVTQGGNAARLGEGHRLNFVGKVGAERLARAYTRLKRSLGDRRITTCDISKHFDCMDCRSDASVDSSLDSSYFPSSISEPPDGPDNDGHQRSFNHRPPRRGVLRIRRLPQEVLDIVSKCHHSKIFGSDDKSKMFKPCPRSMQSSAAVHMEFVNATDGVLELEWIDHRGEAWKVADCEASTKVVVRTFAAHQWRIQTKSAPNETNPPVSRWAMMYTVRKRQPTQTCVFQKANVPNEKPTPSILCQDRCHACNKKTGLMGFQCHCGRWFCSRHKNAEDHNCAFDYKKAGKATLSKDMPKTVANQLERI